MVASLAEENRRKLRQVGISTLTTCLYRRGFRNVWLRGLRPAGASLPRLVGEAFTLRFIPAREDVGQMADYAAGPSLHQRAFEECPPRHVLVLSAGGETEACSCGNLLIGRLKARGVAGIVTDGGYRDVVDIATLGFPAYHASPASPPSFLKLHAVAMGEPIGCAKVAIYPGDVMVGDSEGVIAIPASCANEVATEAYEMTRYDGFAAEQIAAGRSLLGIYPPNDTARREFEEWKRSAQNGEYA
jgi:regulator of RNase E activity RraA